MKNFRFLNTITGWIAFAVAAVTYLMTIEPTASFWDCGEFISAAYKFDVGHPPGAPFFMLTAKFFTLFTSDVTKVAMLVNAMSALASAFTILFLFWTITYLAKKVIGKPEEEFSTTNIIIILGSGLVGALAYTFSDTFWYSAVEGEVYAYSSLFTAVVFWLVLKWDENADNPGSDRWLILIAYLMGLSIGVHLLNLLAIPAIVLVYYYRRYTPSIKGVISAMAISFAILAFVQYGLISETINWATRFELLFVNTFKLPYNTGLFFYLALVMGLLVWAVYETHANKNYTRMIIAYMLAITMVGIPFLGGSILIGVIIIAALLLFFFYKKDKITPRWLNTSALMIVLMLIGYSTYTVIVIRSAAQPTMDQNSPDNVFSLQYYLNREQYGDRPLFYGGVYSAPPKLKVEGNTCTYDADKKPLYAPKPKRNPSERDEYVVAGHKFNYKKNDKFMMLFPRMYSSQATHINAYKIWGNIKGRSISYDFCGEQRTEIKPTFGENLRFFFDYQVNFMYWRYFMWNFSGRQNDIQGSGEIEHGNWITGIKFIDNMLVGNQDLLPTVLKENKGRNKYYMLPLLLGLIGIFFLLNSGKKANHAFWIVLLLFFMTGLAIVIYLNQTPYQPRERDYAYAGSFYAFAIWIGLGVMGIGKIFDRFLPKNLSAIIATVACLGIPALMASENWDDHDRSGRTTARDFGQNYLNSVDENAILFSNGDNDTFPLWYNQEVEGVRTDVRVCNLSYLPTDWYIDQMKRGAYESAPLPISWERKDYITGTNDVLSVQDLTKGEPFNMIDAFEIIKSDDKDFKIEGDGFFPSSKLFLNVDPDQVIATGTLPAERKDEILPQITFDLPRNVFKGEAMVYEMIKENQWKRPMYMCVTVGEEYYPQSLPKYFERTGLALQILPVAQRDSNTMNVNTDKMYENMMTKFKFGGIENPKVYIDDNIMRMCKTHRIAFSYLIEALIAQGDTARAKEALLYCDKVIPSHNVPYDFSSNMLAFYAYEAGLADLGNKILDEVGNRSVEYLNWYASLKTSQRNVASNSIGHEMAVLNNVLQISSQSQAKEIFDKYIKEFEAFATKFNMK
ncbi:MAG: DUF2723 domain-containing protein [Porphyromonadaceae bacterium]|nr:DUF2723 domain-containing protein [Porphyromonadaceae bacterium]